MNNRFIRVGYEEFVNTLKEAKASLSPRQAWRVELCDVESCARLNASCYVTELGSAVAVTQDGEILSLCRHLADELTPSVSLVEFAKEVGGYK